MSTYVNQALSKEMHVTPLAKGEVATYQLINSAIKDASRVDEKGKPMPQRPGYLLIGQKDIYDPIAQKTVTITNKMVRRKTKTPVGEVVIEKAESVRFLSDKLLYVDHTQPELYQFLERVAENRDNPFRGHNKKKAVFFRVNAKKRANDMLEKDYFEYDAIKWVMERATTLDKLKACAEKANEIRKDLNIKTEFRIEEEAMAFSVIKRALFALAKEDPKTLIKASNDEVSQIKMQIADAEKFGIIIFPDTANQGDYYRVWCFNDGSELVKIVKVDTKEHKIDGLVNHFRSKEGSKDYVRIVEKLKKVLSPQ